MESTFFSNILLPLVLAIIMFGMGLNLTLRDLRSVFRFPKATFVGLACQMLVLPAWAFLLAWISPLPASMKVGLVLIAACPGGATSNLLSYLVKGKLALSIAMTSVNSFLVIFSIPLIVSLALEAFMGTTKSVSLDFWGTVLNILIITVVPTALGIFLRRKMPRFANRMQKPLKYTMPLMLAVAMVMVIFFEDKSGPDIQVTDLFRVLPWALAINLGGILLGFFLARKFQLDKKSQVTIGIEVGMQNSALAIAVAMSQTMLDNPLMAVPASVYALFSFVTTIAFGLIANRNEIDFKEIFSDMFARRRK